MWWWCGGVVALSGLGCGLVFWILESGLESGLEYGLEFFL